MVSNLLGNPHDDVIKLHIIVVWMMYHMRHWIFCENIYLKPQMTIFSDIYSDIYMSHFTYVCKMRYLLNLVLESWEYLWFYWTFCIVILDYGLKLHKLSIHTLVMLQKWLEIH